MRTQRRFVVVLAMALGLWLLAVATHIHSRDEHPSSANASSACSFCMSLPSAAAPPSHIAAPTALFVAISTVLERTTPSVLLDLTSHYFSRGPPR